MLLFALSALLAVALAAGEEMTAVHDLNEGAHVAHKCIHDKVAKLAEHIVEPLDYPVYDEATRKRQSTVPTAPLRIKFDTFNLGAQ